MAKILNIIVVASLVGLAAHAAEERVIQIQNRVRAGFDDNVNLVDEDMPGVDVTETAFITEILTINGVFNFSERTDALVFWQPEFQYREDDDADSITRQDVYGRLNHAISQRAFLELSDRLRYLERDAQQSPGAAISDDRNYLENNLQGALTYTASDQGMLRVGGSYEMRQWDDSDYGKINDYDRIVVNGYYQHEFRPDTTEGLAGVRYEDHDYESDHGYDALTVFGGVNQTFSPALTGYGQVGASMNNVDEGEDTTTPYLEAGLEYSATERTTVNGSVGYSISQTENLFYSAQDRLSAVLGIGHDLTGKIRISTSVSYVLSTYDADYAYVTPAYVAAFGAPEDSDETYITAVARASYQINRNNFVEVGYQYSDRSGDLNEYGRNVVDIGWRLRL